MAEQHEGWLNDVGGVYWVMIRVVWSVVMLQQGQVRYQRERRDFEQTQGVKVLQRQSTWHNTLSVMLSWRNIISSGVARFGLHTFYSLRCWRHADHERVRSEAIYSMSKKNPPEVFWLFPKQLGIFGPNFTYLLHVPIYAKLNFFIQLFPTMTKLCHIKCDHPCVSADGGYFEHKMVVALNMGWDNFVKVAGNLIKNL